MTTIEELVEKVENWDCEDIDELVDLLNQIDELDESGYTPVRMDSLPCAQKYEERVMALSEKGYTPVWTCDENGNILYGPAADEIMKIWDLETEAGIE